MKVDLYTKAILTIIAVALIVIAAKETPVAHALSEGCGKSFDPCFITAGPPLSVFVTNIN